MSQIQLSMKLVRGIIFSGVLAPAFGGIFVVGGINVDVYLILGDVSKVSPPIRKYSGWFSEKVSCKNE